MSARAHVAALAAPRPAASLTRRIATLFTAGAAGQVVAILAGIVQARTLGPDGKSVLAYAAIALGFVTLAADGLGSAIIAQVGRDRARLAQIAAAMQLNAAALALPAVTVAVGLGLAVPSQRPLLGAAVAIPFALYALGARGLLLALGASMAVAWQGALPAVVANGVLIGALVVARVDATAALAIWAAGQAGAAVLAAVAVTRRVRPRYDATVIATAREQLAFGARSSLATAAGYVNLRIDVFVVSALLGPVSLGIYTLAVAAGELLWSISAPVAYATIDRVAGDAFADAAALTARLTRSIAALQATIGIVLFVVAPPLIALVYGRAFAPAGAVLRVLLPGLIIYAVEISLGSFILLRLRRPLTIGAIQLGSAATCGALSLVLIPRFGLLGAAVATSLTYVATILVKSAIFVRATGTPWRTLWLPTPHDAAPLLSRLRSSRR